MEGLIFRILRYMNNLICQRKQEMETRSKLTKTSGTVTPDMEKIWPIADWRVPSINPTNNSGHINFWL